MELKFKNLKTLLIRIKWNPFWKELKTIIPKIKSWNGKELKV